MDDRDPTERNLTPDDGTTGEHDVDRLLRDAGARLRSTAPGASAGIPPSSTRTGRRRWLAAAAAVGAAAAALVAIVVILPRGDESVRQVPTDSSPDITSGTTLDTLPEVDPSVEPATTDPATTDPATTLPDSPIQLEEHTAVRDWDGDGGRCYTLTVARPGSVQKVPMCVTGFQIEHGVDAYVRGDGYAYRWYGTTQADGEVGTLTGGGMGEDVVGFDGVPPSDEVPCGPPIHEVPTDRWVMVSNCGGDEERDAALYTLLPDSPDGTTSYLVGTTYGMVVDANLVQSLDTGVPVEKPDRLDVFEVPSALSGVLLRCVLVVPATADQWFELCRGADEGPWNAVFLHAGLPYVLQGPDASPPLLLALPAEATLRSNGCMSPVVELLAAMADPTGMLGRAPSLMVTGVACPAATDAFAAPTVDATVSAAFSGVLLRAGPADGGLVAVERQPGGALAVTDTGTGIEPDPSTLPIPPARWFWVASDDLPPVDLTASVAGLIAPAAGRAALVDSIAAYLAEQYPTDGGPPHDVLSVPGSPLIVALDVRYLDDSVASGFFSFWLDDRDGSVAVERVIVVNSCARGLTEVDGVLLCV